MTRGRVLPAQSQEVQASQAPVYKWQEDGEKDRRFGAVSLLLQVLYRTVVVKNRIIDLLVCLSMF